jgi:hypothetical protein
MGSWWAEYQVARIVKKKWARSVRAIALLEFIHTPEAVTILKEMASGHPEAQPTRVAKEALGEREGKAS